ncbi:hypothetical protein F7725_020932 [Dissostichus mawsoni]|uniref:Uncharacterized protein n=1 Tax=Dissostichus mawsoni TaxID=36200 RepID=A0A7J5YEL4_DISMA|nr:hypothetical protein F7725_020932 [Dissostichus mawsoni]
MSWRRSLSGFVDLRSRCHRTACRPSNVRKRALFAHRPVWTRSFRFPPSIRSLKAHWLTSANLP